MKSEHYRNRNIKVLRQQRRFLRTNSTEAEVCLWRILKSRNVAGLQFRRQYSVDKYILDFYCPTLRLAIELDGDYHFNGLSDASHDYDRDKQLKEKYNITVIRFENRIVFEQPDAIVNNILLFKEGK